MSQKKKHATKEQTELRINTIYEMMLDGASRQDILHFGREKWDVGESNLDELMGRARKILLEELKEEQSSNLKQHRRARWRLHAKAKSIGKFELCLQIQQDIAKLDDLYPEEKSALNVKSNKPITFVSMQGINVKQA